MHWLNRKNSTGSNHFCGERFDALAMLPVKEESLVLLSKCKFHHRFVGLLIDRVQHLHRCSGCRGMEKMMSWFEKSIDYVQPSLVALLFNHEIHALLASISHPFSDYNADFLQIISYWVKMKFLQACNSYPGNCWTPACFCICVYIDV